MKNILINNFATIKTSQLSKLSSVYMYANSTSITLLKTFEKEGLIRGFKYLDKTKGLICVYLKYRHTGKSIISDLLCVSNAKRRVYLKNDQLKRINDSLNIYIISNKKGEYNLNYVRDNKFKLGGEIKYIVKVNTLNDNLHELFKRWNFIKIRI
uniref:Ribosomal protein S8 n=1 Tax=Heterostelium pallidum TaxID=13642 RepID=Q5ILK4_HETPA|nr:ribosomal protein S8 [Heterostelium pallidum]AAU00606.1 ribosomal protein S8 [Heterostelium pallidum]